MINDNEIEFSLLRVCNLKSYVSFDISYIILILFVLNLIQFSTS